MIEQGEVLGTARGVVLPPMIQPREIARLAYQAGFTDIDELVTMVAICFGESDGGAGSHNDNLTAISDLRADQKVRNAETGELCTVVDPATGKIRLSSGEIQTVPLTVEFVVSRDVGLWQISIPASQIGSSVEANLYVPANNAAAARAKFNAQGFNAWVAYTTGVYESDRCCFRASLGTFNFAASFLAMKLPVVSLPTLRKLYPDRHIG